MVFSRETGNYPPLPPDHRDVRSICQLPAPEFLARLFATVNPLPNLQPTRNLAPTDDAPVIRLDRETGARNLDVLKGGLISPGSGRVRTNAQKALSCSEHRTGGDGDAEWPLGHMDPKPDLLLSGQNGAPTMTIEEFTMVIKAQAAGISVEQEIAVLKGIIDTLKKRQVAT
jgi:hypothetical protein